MFDKKMKIHYIALIPIFFMMSCALPAPKYMTNAKNVRILNANAEKSVILSDIDAKELTTKLDGRLFTYGDWISDKERDKKKHIVTIVYPYSNAVMIVCNEKGGKVDEIDMGDGETFLDVYSDGTVGYLRTLKTYQIYSIPKYAEQAIYLGKKYGLIKN